MYITHERLAELKAQRDHLSAMWDHAFNQNVLRLSKQSVPANELEAIATEETDYDFDAAGLMTTANRLRIEIAFLESELNG